MTCPACGHEMNHHASKIAYDSEDLTKVDPVFGGVVKEVHTCPQCGLTEMTEGE